MLVSLAIIAFFWRDDKGLPVWGRVIAPSLGAVGLSACFALMVINLDLVSSSTSLVVQNFPVLLAPVGLGGAGLALWIKRQRSGANPDIVAE